MAVIHRALFTWFVMLLFLILLCLRLESRTHWNWFIVFIPVWFYDSVLLLYSCFHIISFGRNRSSILFSCNFNQDLVKSFLYFVVILLKIIAQILFCLKFEMSSLNLSIYHIFLPIWILLLILIFDCFLRLKQFAKAITNPNATQNPSQSSSI